MKHSVRIFITKDFVIAKQVPYVDIIFDDETSEIIVKNLIDKRNLSLNDVLNGENLIVGKGGKEFKPSDGMEFMKNLKYQFSGSYVRADDVKEYQDESQ